RFDFVIDLGAGAVSVDIANVGWVKSAVLDCCFNAGNGATAVRVAVGDAEGVGGGTVTGDLGINVCAAVAGVLQLFEHEHAGTFTEHEAVALQVKGPRSLFGGIVAGGQGREKIEPCHTKGIDHAMGAAGEHDIGVAVANQLGS